MRGIEAMTYCLFTSGDVRLIVFDYRSTSFCFISSAVNRIVFGELYLINICTGELMAVNLGVVSVGQRWMYASQH